MAAEPPSGSSWRTRLYAQLWPTVVVVYGFLRSSAPHRFAALLVRSGTLLMAGPSAYLLLAIAVLDRVAPPEQPNYLDAGLSIATFVVGMIMVGGGVWLFRHNVTVTRMPTLSVTVQGGWSFEHTAREVIRGRTVTFENFTEGELQTPLRESDLELPNDVTVLRILGDLAYPPGLPQYTVEEQDGRVIVRAINVKQEGDTKPPGG